MEKTGEEIIFSGPKIDSAPYEEPLWSFLKRNMESFGDSTALVSQYISLHHMCTTVAMLAVPSFAAPPTARWL